MLEKLSKSLVGHRSRFGVLALLTVLTTACGGGGDSVSQTQPPAPDPAAACTVARAEFFNSVWPSLERNCVACHNSSGAAAATAFVLLPSGRAEQNLEIIRAYAAKQLSTLLSKSIGLPQHAGGAPFGSKESPDYKALKAFGTQIAKAECSGAPEGSSGGEGWAQASDYWTRVARESPAQTLIRSAVLLAGRKPSGEELRAIGGGDQAVLRRIIREYMEGEAFMGLIDDIGVVQFLSPGVVVSGAPGGLDANDWPVAGPVLGADDIPLASTEERRGFEWAIRREPVELLKFIVRNDRPYTDIVSARYTVANDALVKYLGASLKGGVDSARTGWGEATLPNHRTGGVREHAGVLSTHAWLQRFPTTDTNRNRHRVYSAFRQFLATDIEALAARPLDDSVVFKVPTVENPACAVCHSVMDPIAAGFQNWDENNRYRPNDRGGAFHALPGPYLSRAYPLDAMGMRYYRSGDNWFRDQADPGYGAAPMPGGFEGSETALQWTGQRLASDPRFPLGAVHFFYKGVFGKEPLRAPQNDASNGDYANQLAAYRAQHEEFQAIAASFATDRGYGPFNVKDLISDLLVSKTGTAERIREVSPEIRGSLFRGVGAVGVLPPSQLNRKLVTLVGITYADFETPYEGLASLYGEFDGAGSLSPAQEVTLTQAIIGERMSLAIACAATKKDFSLPADQRRLFPRVGVSDAGDSPASMESITSNIVHLHEHLWRRDVTSTDPEMLRTLELFRSVVTDRSKPGQRPSQCGLDDKSDPTYSGRAWAAVLAYMLADPDFLFR